MYWILWNLKCRLVAEKTQECVATEKINNQSGKMLLSLSRNNRIWNGRPPILSLKFSIFFYRPCSNFRFVDCHQFKITNCLRKSFINDFVLLHSIIGYRNAQLCSSKSVTIINCLQTQTQYLSSIYNSCNTLFIPRIKPPPYINSHENEWSML